MIIQVQAQIGSVRQTVDRGCSFSVRTQEVNNDQKLALLNLAGSTGWLLFKEDAKEFDESELPKENTDIEIKSPSQRLRGVMFKVWKQNYSDKGTFEEWRSKQMEGIINQYKDKLDV